MRYSIDEIQLIVRNSPGVEKVVSPENLNRPIKLHDEFQRFSFIRETPFPASNLSLSQRQLLWTTYFERPNRSDRYPPKLGIVYPMGEIKLLQDMEEHELEDIRETLFSGTQQELQELAAYRLQLKGRNNPELLEIDTKIANIQTAAHQAEAITTAKEANEISRQANRLAEDAVKSSKTANVIALAALVIAAIAVLLELVF